MDDLQKYCTHTLYTYIRLRNPPLWVFFHMPKKALFIDTDEVKGIRSNIGHRFFIQNKVGNF